MGKKVSAKHEKFIQGLLEGKTQTQAYIDAGYSKKYANGAASRLSANDSIRGEIQRRLDEVKQGAKIHLENESLKAATTLTRLLDGGTKDDFCSLYAAKDVLDRVGLKPSEKIEHSGEVSLKFADIIKRARERKHDRIPDD